MHTLPSATVILDQIAKLRSGAKQFHSNLFADCRTLSDWICRDELSFQNAPGAVLLIRRGTGVLHLFHAASDSESLAVALLHLDNSRFECAIVADLVGRPTVIAPICDVYTASGFSNYRAMIRMVRRRQPLSESASAQFSQVEKANPGRVDALRDFLIGLLDPCSEQIPTREDLALAAEKGEVLCSSDDDEISGVLVFRRTGQSCLLRYWFVDPGKHGRGIGAALMRSFLAETSACDRIVLWVFRDNSDSITKYEHYGFVEEALQDWIMLKLPQETRD